MSLSIASQNPPKLGHYSLDDALASVFEEILHEMEVARMSAPNSADGKLRKAFRLSRFPIWGPRFVDKRNTGYCIFSYVTKVMDQLEYLLYEWEHFADGFKESWHFLRAMHDKMFLERDKPHKDTCLKRGDDSGNVKYPTCTDNSQFLFACINLFSDMYEFMYTERFRRQN